MQRVLAAAGFGSRRQCEELIEAGRVDVDGATVTKLGVVVDPEVAKIRVDGVPLKRQKLVYYAVNKPVGVVTTNSDPQGRPRVIDLVPPSERVFPVGRLDRSSEGLILLTNDGELAQRLAHPKFGVQKIYRVTVAGKVDIETMKQMRRGIHIAEGHVRVDGAKLLKARPKSTEMEITLREGKNREIRRILARLGHKVQTLRRIAVGPLRLADTPPGAYRALTKEEVQRLHQATLAPVAPKASASAAEGASSSAESRARSASSGKRATSSRGSAGAERSSAGASRKASGAPRKGSAGPRERSATQRNASAAKRPAASTASRRSSSPDTNARASSADRATDDGIVIRVNREPAGGRVIGADPAPQPEPAKPKPAKPQAAAARRKGTQRVASKRAVRKGTGLGSGKKASASRPRAAKKRKR